MRPSAILHDRSIVSNMGLMISLCPQSQPQMVECLEVLHEGKLVHADRLVLCFPAYHHTWFSVHQQRSVHLGVIIHDCIKTVIEAFKGT